MFWLSTNFHDHVYFIIVVLNTLAAEKNYDYHQRVFFKKLIIISKLQGICVPLGDFNEIHSHLFYFHIEHNMRLILRVKTCQSQKNMTVEAIRVQTAIRRKHQFLPSNAQEEIIKLCQLTKPWLEWWSSWTLRSLCLLVFPVSLKCPGVEHTDTAETVSILLIQFQMFMQVHAKAK